MTNRIKRSLAAEWSAGLAHVLERKTDRAARVELQGTEEAPAGLLWWAQPYGGADPGIWIGVPEASVGNIEEFWQMVSESIAGGAKGRLASAPATDTACAVVDVASGDYAFRVYVAVDDELARPAHSDARASSETLDLLLDLELPVSVSFGKIQIPFQEVLRLATGSIVELNRSVDDPVDIVINDQVIASGEVVVVNGNYAVKIQRIASRSDRLRSADAALLARGVEGVMQ